MILGRRVGGRTLVVARGQNAHISGERSSVAASSRSGPSVTCGQTRREENNGLWRKVSKYVRIMDCANILSDIMTAVSLLDFPPRWIKTVAV